MIYKKARFLLKRKFLLEVFIEKQLKYYDFHIINLLFHRVFTIIAEDIDQPFINLLEIPEFEGKSKTFSNKLVIIIEKKLLISSGKTIEAV